MQKQRLQNAKVVQYNNDTCLICLQQYSGNFWILSCYHKFDIECFIKWGKPHCPLCRKDIYSKEYEEIKKKYILKGLSVQGQHTSNRLAILEIPRWCCCRY